MIWKVGKLGKVGQVGKVGKVGQVGKLGKVGQGALLNPGPPEHRVRLVEVIHYQPEIKRNGLQQLSRTLLCHPILQGRIKGEPRPPFPKFIDSTFFFFNEQQKLADFPWGNGAVEYELTHLTITAKNKYFILFYA